MADLYLEFDPPSVADAMGVEEDEAIRLMNDGRYASPWIETRVRKEFALRDPEGHEDAMSDAGPVEVKGITKYGVKLVPNWMVGSGREMDWDRLEEWFDYMTGGFIVHDNTQFPSVPCWRIDTETVRSWVEDGLFNNDGGMAYNKIMSLL